MLTLIYALYIKKLGNKWKPIPRMQNYNFMIINTE